MGKTQPFTCITQVFDGLVACSRLFSACRGCLKPTPQPIATNLSRVGSRMGLGWLVDAYYGHFIDKSQVGRSTKHIGG